MKGLITWFIENTIAANLLMLALLGLGAVAITTNKQEMFPAIEPNFITVSVVHQGAAPEQTEESICVKIEEALDGVDNIIKLKSTASEGSGMILVEYDDAADKDKVLRDVKNRVDAISTFPADAESPVVTATEFKMPVLSVAIYGEADSPVSLRRLADEIKDEITAMKSVSSVTVVDSKTFEVTIALDEDKLSEFGLTREGVANAVRASSIDQSAGTLRTNTYGEILIRSDRKAYIGADFEKIVIHQDPSGLQITLGQVAKVHDGFAVFDEFIDFDDRPAVLVTVFQVGSQSVPVIANAVKKFIEQRRASLPESFDMSVWNDRSLMLDGRRELMLTNGIQGLVLVFIILALFLRLSLAMWVTGGLITAMVGTFRLMAEVGQSINMMTLFAFIVVLGMLVDNAVVVSENVWYHRKTLRKGGVAAAKDGTLEVLLPVILAVATTVAAFTPMMTIGGTMGQFTRVIPIVVVMALTLSLIEALLILPAHLSHVSPQDKKYSVLNPLYWLDKVQKKVSAGLEYFIQRIYKPLLIISMGRRYLTLWISVLILSIAIGLFAGGFVKWEFFPKIDGDNLIVNLDMPIGTNAKVTEAHLETIEAKGIKVLEEFAARHGFESIIEHRILTVGTQPAKSEAAWETGGGSGGGQGNVGEINIQIMAAEDRGTIAAKDILDAWRKEVGDVQGAVELSFKADVSGSADAINVLLMSDDEALLDRARHEVRKHLESIDGVYDINDDMRPGKLELQPMLRDEGRLLGLTNSELIKQVRQAVFGEETAREQRGSDDLRIKVRMSEANREKVSSIENMKIRLKDGSEVDFLTVAELPPLDRGPSNIKRTSRKRSVNITAAVNSDIASSSTINNQLQKEFLPALNARNPGLTSDLEGAFEQQARTMGDMAMGGLLTIAMIFTVLALAFKSWIQPLIVMAAIPFGMAGAIFGHFIYGATFSLLSAIGVMAMAGVVVNSSLILIDFANRATNDGVSAKDAIVEAGPRRFRAILITSLTTFGGLFPMLLETSLQAKFLIPLAISLGFGVLFSASIVLIIVPALYMIVEDAKRVVGAYTSLLFPNRQDQSVVLAEIDPEHKAETAGQGGARDSIFETVTAGDHIETVPVEPRSEKPTAPIDKHTQGPQSGGIVPPHLRDD